MRRPATIETASIEDRARQLGAVIAKGKVPALDIYLDFPDMDLIALLDGIARHRAAPPPHVKSASTAGDMLLGALMGVADSGPFAIELFLSEAIHGIAPDAVVALFAHLATESEPIVREAALLGLLNSEPSVRRAVGQALQSSRHPVSPASLRRLIALRNWLPADERAPVDRAVQSARGNGVECAQWAAGAPATIYASAIDGAGAQGFIIVAPDGKKFRLASLLVKRGFGIRDAWIAPAASKAAVMRTVDDAGGETSLAAVSRDHLDRAVRHFIGDGMPRGLVPPAGLLAIAELIGAAEWRAEATDWRSGLAQIVGEIPAGERTAARIAEIIEFSEGLGMAAGNCESWFEDDPEIVRIVGAARRNGRSIFSGPRCGCARRRTSLGHGRKSPSWPRPWPMELRSAAFPSCARSRSARSSLSISSDRRRRGRSGASGGDGPPRRVQPAGGTYCQSQVSLSARSPRRR